MNVFRINSPWHSCLIPTVIGILMMSSSTIAQTGFHFSNSIRNNGASIRFHSGVLPNGQTYGGFGYSVNGMNFDLYSVPSGNSGGRNVNNNRANRPVVLNLPELFLCNSVIDSNNNKLIEMNEFKGRRIDQTREGCFREGEPVTFVLHEAGKHEGQNLFAKLYRTSSNNSATLVFSGEASPQRLKRGHFTWRTYDSLSPGNYTVKMFKNGRYLCELKFHVHPRK